MGICRKGLHDLELPGAIYPSGACRACKLAYNAERGKSSEVKERRKALRQAREKADPAWHRDCLEKQAASRRPKGVTQIEKTYTPSASNEEIRAFNKTRAASYRNDPRTRDGWLKSSKKHFDRRRADPTYKFFHSQQSAIQKIFEGKKPGTTQQLMGCSNEEYVQYLRSLFQEGMTMENYGKVWEIDHFIPIAAAIRDPSLKEKVAHYSNHRPAFILDNRTKKDRMPDEEV